MLQSPSTILTCVIFLALACCPRLSAAAFNPRTSSLQIPLNGSVRLSFSTFRPDKPHIDVEAAVRQALQLPGLTRDWRVMDETKVVQHPKARDVQVELVLMPRRTGALQAPALPVRWMDGNLLVEFPQIQVENHIRLGAETIAVPVEVESVGGFPWGLQRSDYDQLGESPLPPGSDVRVEPRPGLQLRFLHGSLAAARLRVADMRLTEAKVALIQRWGDPLLDRSETVTWQLGWIHVEAEEEGEDVVIDLHHEGIISRLRQARIKAEVFSLLDVAPLAEASEDPAVPEAGLPEASSDEPSDEDLEAEFERRMQNLLPKGS